MFPGSAFGVGVTVAELCPPVPDVALPPGVAERPMRLHEMLPGETLTDAELAREIQRTIQVEAVITAYRVERVMQLGARRPASLDRRRGQPGAAVEENELLAVGISEFFPDELASIMNCSRTAATVLADTATTLLTRLPATWEALAAGELDWPRARALAAELGWAARETPQPIVAAVEAAVLPGPRTCPCGGYGRQLAVNCWLAMPRPPTVGGSRPSARPTSSCVRDRTA